ncbi:hypothetical protein NGTWS0302_10560 [Mycolicibacterium cyprinidarum]|uniref:Uncharacterized protein n=1 Tax=Mycolicibacterium cyprinidarum TaxID=2860311 RepID=A0ABQ4V822_9MYCO|nr:hypothetical protein NGTWS1702_13690 [Mycolicibacterium sp. NGTWSNA01]GJF15985.1 hypothetical protein NGTWS0302_10560 [Mycolicibacterium sp. NGTWS0302]
MGASYNGHLAVGEPTGLSSRDSSAQSWRRKHRARQPRLWLLTGALGLGLAAGLSFAALTGGAGAAAADTPDQIDSQTDGQAGGSTTGGSIAVSLDSPAAADDADATDDASIDEIDSSADDFIAQANVSYEAEPSHESAANEIDNFEGALTDEDYPINNRLATGVPTDAQDSQPEPQSRSQSTLAVLDIDNGRDGGPTVEHATADNSPEDTAAAPALKSVAWRPGQFLHQFISIFVSNGTVGITVDLVLV